MKHLFWTILFVAFSGRIGFVCYWDITQNDDPELVVGKFEQAVHEFDLEELADIVTDRNEFASYWNPRVRMLKSNLQGYVIEQAKEIEIEAKEITRIDNTQATVEMIFRYNDGRDSVESDYRDYFENSLYKKYCYTFDDSPEENIEQYVLSWRNDELIIHKFPEKHAEQKLNIMLRKDGHTWRINNDSSFNSAMCKVMLCNSYDGAIAAYKAVAKIENERKERQRQASYRNIYSGNYSSGSSSVTSTRSSVRDNRTTSRRSYGRKTYNMDSDYDPDDYDVDAFYAENRSDFANEDDAWEYLEDEPDDWD